jgi:hypothetical protein
VIVTSHDGADANDDVVADLELIDTQHLGASDWTYLQRLRELVATGADETTARTVLAEIAGGPRNGMVAAIESEVKGLYGLDPSDRYHYVPKQRFAALPHSRLRELVIARIDAIRPGRCAVPEAVYRVEVHTIECDGEAIHVREIARKDWDYLVFESTTGPPAYFAEIDDGTRAMSSVIKRLDAEDSQRLRDGDVDQVELDRMIDRYR